MASGRWAVSLSQRLQTFGNGVGIVRHACARLHKLHVNARRIGTQLPGTSGAGISCALASANAPGEMSWNGGTVG